jgi:hypothetical protein
MSAGAIRKLYMKTGIAARVQHAHGHRNGSDGGG